MRRPSRWLFHTHLVCTAALALALAAGAQASHPAAGLDGPPDPEVLMKDAAAGDVFALERQAASLDMSWHGIARVRGAAAALRTDEAIAAAKAIIGSGQTPTAIRSQAWSVLADAAFADGRYAAAQDAARRGVEALQLEGAPAQAIGDASRTAALAGALSAAPPQAVAGYVPVAVRSTRDRVGLPRAALEVNGHVQEAVLDTGAGLSVVSRSAAERLGLRLLDAAATVDSSTRDAVPIRIGVAETVEFAGLTLRNAAFLVMEDSQLQFPVPGGYSIEAIIGFPLLRELGRIRFQRDGRVVPEPEATVASRPGNLRVVGSAIYVDVLVEGAPTALHLDTGAPTSFLTTRFARRHGRLVDGLALHEEQLAGAGGARARRSARLPSAALSIAGRQAALADLSVVVEDGSEAEASNFGVLGSDVLDQFEHWTIDLRSMSFELGDPVDATAAGAHEPEAQRRRAATAN